MNKNTIHIVSFDVPFPPNYGGVIDIYYKCKALKELGVKIHLHCFQYGREESSKLLKNCESVTYYKRKRFVNPIGSYIPYIVKSRINKRLIQNLAKDNFPILIEGLHCTWPLISKEIDNSRIYVRTHNIEHEYYKRLESVEQKSFKRLYFKMESKKLLGYEKVLSKAKGVVAISHFDKKHFENTNSNTIWASAFHESQEIESESGKGTFALYHGNLSVGENDHAAKYLAAEVFSKVDFPCVIAGNNPSTELVSLCKKKGVELKEDLSSKEIIDLVRDAHVNVLPTFQKTGIKLKLLNALFQGRHCLVNNEMVEDTGLENLCSIANNAEDMVFNLKVIIEEDFKESEIAKRKNELKSFFNVVNAQKIVDFIFDI